LAHNSANAYTPSYRLRSDHRRIVSDMPAPRIAARLIALISRFSDDSRANLAVIFALTLIPVLAAIGCATEYSLATQMKVKMQAAADAATIASISRNSPGYLAATKMTTDGLVSAGVTDASNVFNGNLAP